MCLIVAYEVGGKTKMRYIINFGFRGPTKMGGYPDSSPIVALLRLAIHVSLPFNQTQPSFRFGAFPPLIQVWAENGLLLFLFVGQWY